MTPEFLEDEVADGYFANHPSGSRTAALVAPTAAEEFNLLRKPLRTVACASLPDTHFEFDSSFLLPSVRNGLKKLAEKLREHPRCPVVLFGHADPVGDDNYNKELSRRRARAVYGLLTHDLSVWDDLFGKSHGRDSWGTRSLERILEILGYTPGRSDGRIDDDVRNALKKFQNEHGVPSSGEFDDRARKALFEAYAEYLYGSDFTPLDKKQDFLGAGADKDGRGDYSGCGEFNPILVVSRAEKEKFDRSVDKSERNEVNSPNRRVLIFLFEAGTTIAVDRWPCPKPADGIAACKKRFYSDGDKRRRNGESRREYRVSQDTFACRFYDRLARESPCENPIVARRIPFQLQLHDALYEPCPDAEYEIALPSGQALKGKADGEGWIRGTVYSGKQSVKISYKPKESETTYVVRAFVSEPDAQSDAAYLAHMRNFGFDADDGDDEGVILRFQAAHQQLKLSGVLDAETKKAVDDILHRTLKDAFEEADNG